MSKFLLIGTVAFVTVSSVLAQGTLMQAQLQFLTTNAHSATATFYVPDPSSEIMLQTVTYDVLVNTDAPLFTDGRIAGGITSWAFRLETPVITNGTARYIGSTDLFPPNLRDILAGRTTFALMGTPLPDVYMVGAIVPVPEPGMFAVCALAGVCFAFSRRWRLSQPNTTRGSRLPCSKSARKRSRSMPISFFGKPLIASRGIRSPHQSAQSRSDLVNVAVGFNPRWAPASELVA